MREKSCKELDMEMAEPFLMDSGRKYRNFSGCYSVRVDQTIGCCTFPRATADLFEADVLVVAWLDSARDAHVFEPGDWIEAHVMDESGRVVLAFASEYGIQQAAERLAVAQMKALTARKAS